MKKSGLALLIFIAITALSTTSAQSCNACNCQFNNIQVLSKLVEAQVNRTLVNEPMVRLLSVLMDVNRQLKLFASNHTTLETGDSTQLAAITITDSSRAVTSFNNLFAYRPRFSDNHGSNLAGAFVNLEGVFACLQSLSTYYPICQVFSEEEDGFRNGKVLIGSGDIGNNFRVFSSTSNILTFGIAIQGCPEFTSSCFPTIPQLFSCLLSTKSSLLLIYTSGSLS